MSSVTLNPRSEKIQRRGGRRGLSKTLARWCLMLGAVPGLLHAQIIRGTVSSAVGAGRVPGAVILLLDSSLTTRARALTSDSGTFAIGALAPGRFHLKVMRIGFRPTESRVFDLARDTTIDVALTDIPVVLPAVSTRDRNDCRLHPDTTQAGLLTFALWEQAHTAFLAAAITLEQRDYRFEKLQHVRLYEVRPGTLRDISLREVETHGTAPWVSLPAERLREGGYAVEDDSGMTFFAPDLDVLLSSYFTEAHCLRLATHPAPAPGLVGLDFEPNGRPRHVEIRGTIWLDSASNELRTLRFTFVNLPVSAPDTLLGGHIGFTRIGTGAWIIPSWSISMPTPVRRQLRLSNTPSRWRLTADWIRVAGGELRAVRRGDAGDSVPPVWRAPTGSVRVRAVDSSDSSAVYTSRITIHLAGSPYAGYTANDGTVTFSQLLPGSYLFEATTPLHDAIEAIPSHVLVAARADTTIESRLSFKPLPLAAAEVCDDKAVGREKGVVAGHVTSGDGKGPVAQASVTVEWTGDAAKASSRNDGYFRVCGVPREQLLLVRASREKSMATTTLTLAPDEVVRVLDLTMKP